MSKFVRKVFFIIFIFLIFQSLISQIHVPHANTFVEIAKDGSKEKTLKMNEILQYTSGKHVLGFGLGEMFIVSHDHGLKIEFVKANPVWPEAHGDISETNGFEQKPSPLQKVSYKNLWEGVTLVCEKSEGGISKSSYYIDAQKEGTMEAKVSQIRFHANVPVELAEDGGLVFKFKNGEMRESRPEAWQDIDGEMISVNVSFFFFSEKDVGFLIDRQNIDPHYPLIIDPVFHWNTFLGSFNIDTANSLALDANGNIFVAGSSWASWGTPVNGYKGGSDAFVAMLNSSGVLQWNTFLGSWNTDYAYSLALDKTGNIYVAGDSNSTWGTPVNAFAGSYDGFVAKLNSSGVLQWNTFMGSSSYDWTWSLALGEFGNVYVAGYSYTTWGTPVNDHSGVNKDGFVAKLNSSGVLQWNTFMGPIDTDVGVSLAPDGTGNIYLAGASELSWGTPINPHTGGYTDGFVAKLDSSGVLQWNTFLGSSSGDEVSILALDANGNIYVAGNSGVTWGTPVNAFAGEETDVFIAKLNSGGVLQWNTFLGSTDSGYANSLALDGTGNIYVAGDSNATWGAPINPYSGSTDAFAVKLNASGARLWHTFMGSSSNDFGNDIAVDTSGNIFVAGYSWDVWGTPINPHIGERDAFVVKIVDTSIYVFDGHDFNGNGSSDVSVFRQSQGRWYIKGVGSYIWGTTGDIPVNGDYNGEAKTDVAVWRPSNGKWYLRGIGSYTWGTSGDIPVPGDYNGDVDGTTEMAVWRPSNGRWYIKGVGGFVWGTAGDIPVPGDYNGDGKTEIAVWRPTNGRWYIKGVGGHVWGTAGDIPIPGDYNGDGKTEVAVWRSSNGRWYIKGMAGPVWGTAGDIPAPGDYNGDGTTDIAVWRPSNGRWYIKGIGGYVWGIIGDIPLVR